MCIVCDIKKAGANDEVMPLVHKLAEGLETALTVAQEVAQANPGVFSDEQRDRMQSAADLLNQRESGIGGLAAVLAAILSGAKVETVRVELKPGESFEDAITRVMAEHGEQPTKH